MPWAAPEPALAIVAAVHGGEYPGILGTLACGRATDPVCLRGSVLILSIVNPPVLAAAIIRPPARSAIGWHRLPAGCADAAYTGSARDRLACSGLRLLQWRSSSSPAP